MIESSRGKYLRTDEHRFLMSARYSGKQRPDLTKYPGLNARDKYLIHKYGITELQYNEMFDKQKGKCKICGEPESRKLHGTICKLSVDHDHKTGKVRGLLCNRCNHMLGVIKDNSSIALNMHDYLENRI